MILFCFRFLTFQIVQAELSGCVLGSVFDSNALCLFYQQLPSIITSIREYSISQLLSHFCLVAGLFGVDPDHKSYRRLEECKRKFFRCLDDLNKFCTEHTPHPSMYFIQSILKRE